MRGGSGWSRIHPSVPFRSTCIILLDFWGVRLAGWTVDEVVDTVAVDDDDEVMVEARASQDGRRGAACASRGFRLGSSESCSQVKDMAGMAGG